MPRYNVTVHADLEIEADTADKAETKAPHMLFDLVPGMDCVEIKQGTTFELTVEDVDVDHALALEIQHTVQSLTTGPSFDFDYEAVSQR